MLQNHELLKLSSDYFLDVWRARGSQRQMTLAFKLIKKDEKQGRLQLIASGAESKDFRTFQSKPGRALLRRREWISEKK